jgi:hypothetical protein
MCVREGSDGAEGSVLAIVVVLKISNLILVRREYSRAVAGGKSQ